MSESDNAGFSDFSNKTPATEADFEDKEIECIDCGEDFVWSSGEQLFFSRQGTETPP